MEYTESNKLIAEFMGLIKVIPDEDDFKFYGEDYEAYVTISGEFHRSHMDGMYGKIKTHQLRYHCEWSALMPVVKKISKLHSSEVKCYAHEFYTAKERVIKKTIDTDIKTLYRAVIQFINWYNSIS